MRAATTRPAKKQDMRKGKKAWKEKGKEKLTHGQLTQR